MRYLDEIDTPNETTLFDSIHDELSLGTKHFDKNGIQLETVESILGVLQNGSEVTVLIDDVSYTNVTELTLFIGE